MNIRFTSGGALAIVICLATATVQARPVARIIQVEGKVTITLLAPKRASRPAMAYGAVSEKERIDLSKGSSVELAFIASGRRATVTAKGNPEVVTVAARGLTPEAAVAYTDPPKKLADDLAIVMKDMPDLGANGVTIARGPVPEQATLRLRPIDHSEVTSTTPTFEWPVVEGADEYVIFLSDARSRQIWSQTVTDGETATPNFALAVGREFKWQVMAKTDGVSSEVCRAQFEVINPEDFAGIAEIAKSDDFGLLALAACGFEQQNMVLESIGVYEALRKQRPKEPAFAAALADLYERAGEAQAAAKAREQAVELGFEFESEETKEE